MNPPDDFLEAYGEMRTHFDWAMARGEDFDVPHAKLVTEDLRAFFARWLGRIGDPEVEAGLESFQNWLFKLERKLEEMSLLHLIKVIEARKDWMISELLFQGSIAQIELMKSAPPHLLPGLEKIYRESMGYDFEPEREFRESEVDLDAARLKYEQAVRTCEVDWAERLTPEVRKRLREGKAEDLNAWMAELHRRVRKLQRVARRSAG